MNELREACKEFRKRFNGFNDQSDDYIAKHFDVQLSLLSEVLSSQAANREKDAEIERLKEAFQQSIERRESLCARLEESEKLLESCLKKSELDSLRASVGDKWIAFNEGVEAAAVAVEEGWDGWDGVVARIRREKHPVAPTLPREEK